MRKGSGPKARRVQRCLRPIPSVTRLNDGWRFVEAQEKAQAICAVVLPSHHGDEQRCRLLQSLITPKPLCTRWRSGSGASFKSVRSQTKTCRPLFAAPIPRAPWPTLRLETTRENEGRILFDRFKRRVRVGWVCNPRPSDGRASERMPVNSEWSRPCLSVCCRSVSGSPTPY